MDKGYASPATSAQEVAPRSPHHAAMLVLEQRVGVLSVCIERMRGQLEPALVEAVPVNAANPNPVPPPPPPAPMIAHADDIRGQVDSCISRMEDLLDRLVI
jgi:hypothetical protein